MYIARTLEQSILRETKRFPVLLVTGSRQVGKTTILKKIGGKDRRYVTLDDPLVLDLARRDPALFMKRFEPPVLIDEIQYAPGLLPYIKLAADTAKKKGLFWLTGSQQYHLMKGVSESLAGRVGVLNLLGLSRREMTGRGMEARPLFNEPQSQVKTPKLTLGGLYRHIWRGSYPGIALDKKMDRDLFYGSYVQTYIQRDVRDLAKVGNEMSFLRFLRAAAARSGQMLNLAELARDADIAFNTAKSWLSILQSSYVVYLLEPYHNNITKRLVKTPKLYFLDTGLCAYLTEWTSPPTLEAGAMSGAILETWILTEMLKSYWHAGKRAPFYYYRDKDMKEIDLLIVQDGIVHPYEFKRTASPNAKDIRHFSVLDTLKVKRGIGGLICLTDQSLPLDERTVTIPVGDL